MGMKESKYGSADGDLPAQSWKAWEDRPAPRVFPIRTLYGRDLADAIVEDREPMIPVREKPADIITSIYRSAKENKEVVLPL